MPRKPARKSIMILLVAVLIVGAALWWRHSWRVAEMLGAMNELPPVTAQDHVRGEMSAAITVIEYGDLECVVCRGFHRQLISLQREIPFRWVFRHNPLEMGKGAERLARASECAAREGKFWEFIDAVYDTGATGDEPGVMARVAGAARIDGARLEQCLQSDEAGARVLRDRHDGQRLGVKVTPTFYVNGRRYRGAMPEQRLREIFAQATP